MPASQRNSCLLYSLLRFIADEKVFIDYDTLEPLPIITNHLMSLAQTCGPSTVYHHEILFAGPEGEEKKKAFINHPRMKVALQNYVDKFLKDKPVGPIPPPPAWIDISPGSNSELNALFSQRSRSRKQRKQQKQTRKQKQVKRR